MSHPAAPEPGAALARGGGTSFAPPHPDSPSGGVTTDRIALGCSSMRADSQQGPAGSPPPGGLEEQHQLLLECLSDCAVFLLDPQGRVASWNDAAGRLLGYPGDEVLGR